MHNDALGTDRLIRIFLNSKPSRVQKKRYSRNFCKVGGCWVAATLKGRLNCRSLLRGLSTVSEKLIYITAFGLNTERYSVRLRIKSE